MAREACLLNQPLPPLLMTRRLQGGSHIQERLGEFSERDGRPRYLLLNLQTYTAAFRLILLGKPDDDRVDVFRELRLKLHRQWLPHSWPLSMNDSAATKRSVVVRRRRRARQ